MRSSRFPSISAGNPTPNRLILAAVAVLHLIAMVGISTLRPTRSDHARPPTVTLLTLQSSRSSEPDLGAPPIPMPSQTTTPAPALVPMPELVITPTAPATTSHITTEDPCLRIASDLN